MDGYGNTSSYGKKRRDTFVKEKTTLQLIGKIFLIELAVIF